MQNVVVLNTLLLLALLLLPELQYKDLFAYSKIFNILKTI